MEPITLCGGIILLFGLWLEFEPLLKSLFKKICNSKFYKWVVSESTASSAQRPIYGKRQPICFAKSNFS